MGLIRGALLVFVCVLLFVSFFLMGTFATLNLSLEYDTAKSQVTPLMKDLVEDKVDSTLVEDYEDILRNYCNVNSEYVFKDQETGHTFVIHCDTIGQGPDAIIEEEINSLFDDNYYKEYECDFWKCFKELDTPLFLVSQHAKDHWRSNYYTFLLVSLVLAGLVFLLVNKKLNFPILAGILLGISFIPVSILDSIGKAILNVIFSSAKRAINGLDSIDISSFVVVFFSRADDVFLTGFIIGLILVAIGIFFKLLKVGFKIGNLFKFEFGNKKREKDEIKKKAEEKKPKSKGKKGEIALVE